MEEMILAQSGLAGPILEAPASGSEAIATAVSRAAEAGEPIVVTGCGTSEHGAMAVAALLDEALRDIRHALTARSSPGARCAFDPRAGGVCIGISHEGTTRATILALEMARGAGAVTASIGAQAGSPLATGCRSRADDAAGRPLVVPHGRLYERHPGRRSGGARTRGRPDGRGRGDRGRSGMRPKSRPLADHVHGASRILTVGLGADQITARELALKIEEGARIPTTALHLETLLHGHLAGCDAGATALVLFAADSRQGARRDSRLAVAAGAAGEIGMPTVVIGAETALGRPTRREPVARGSDGGGGSAAARAAHRGGCAATADAGAGSSRGLQPRLDSPRAVRLPRSRSRGGEPRRLVALRAGAPATVAPRRRSDVTQGDSRACAIACASSSRGCAPTTSTRQSITKAGTPVAPARCALAVETSTAAPRGAHRAPGRCPSPRRRLRARAPRAAAAARCRRPRPSRRP